MKQLAGTKVPPIKNQGGCGSCRVKPKVYKVDSWGSVQNSVSKIKKALCRYGALGITVTVEDYMLYIPAIGAEVSTDKHTHLGFDVSVRRVVWLDAVACCKWLSEREGKTVRLPTEAEWEYAVELVPQRVTFLG